MYLRLEIIGLQYVSFEGLPDYPIEWRRAKRTLHYNLTGFRDYKISSHMREDPVWIQFLLDAPR